MSAALAYPTPHGDSRRDQGSRSRHIEVVTTSTQRRARPKAVYAIVTVIGVFALFIAQLLLSIVISDGAYTISSLNAQQRQLDREVQALSEQIDLLSSPQNLATKAESLGMVLSATSPAFVRLSDGAVIGQGSGGAAGNALLGATGSLVPNSLLDSLAIESAQVAATAGSASAADGAPDIAPASTAVVSTLDSLPSPVTR